MRTKLMLAALLAQVLAFGQRDEFFKDVSRFDSTYTIVGLAQGFGKSVDSLERFWFVLDSVSDMDKIKKEWVFGKPIPMKGFEEVSFDLFVIKDKRIATRSGLIYPKYGIINNGYGGWYAFDTAKLVALHASHPLHYHKEKRTFEKYNQYAAYGNSILHDPKLLFFFEPSMRFEGKFEIIAPRSSDQSSPLFVLSDINRELKQLAAPGSFEAEHMMNDSFNILSRDRVKVVVNCSKTLYDRYSASKRREKGSWQPAPIEIVTFWRDDL